MPLPAPLADIETLGSDLAEVERTLLEVVRSSDEFLTEVASHLIRAGGKRLRPAFVVVTAGVGGPGGPATREAVLGGVACELVHLGSLYHDDVMDEATTRRSVEAVNARWGNLQAILAGDYLLAKASEIAAGLGTEVAALLAATIARLCEGQVLELRNAYNPARTVDSYLASIAGKTAALFATACRIGGIVGGLDAGAVEAVTRFGDRYGMAFQIVDDILDVVATDAELGKPSGNDIREGVYTLPVLYALEREPELADMLGGPVEDGDLRRCRELVISSGAVAESLRVAETYIGEAVGALAAVPAGPATEALAGAARSLVAQPALHR